VGDLHLHRSIPTLFVAGLTGACTLALLGLPAVARQARSVGGAFRHLFHDLAGVFLSRRGVVAIVLCALPIGSAAASALFSALATDWGASGRLVFFVNGVGGGVAGVAGSLLGGWFTDRMERRTAYVAAGLLVSVASFGFALSPKTAAWYAAGVLAYYLAQGITWSTWSGFVLGEIGQGAAATKYNLLAALATAPIALMTWVDGEAADRWGRVNMLWVDGAAGVVGAIAFVLVLLLVRRRTAPASLAET